jgi:hypothetical protein
LALLEVERGPLLPWRPDNSLHEQPYDARVDALGSDEAADLLASFYNDTNELVLDDLDRVAAGEPRLAIAFDLMIATAHALSGLPLAESFVSFRSHAEGFLHTPMGSHGQRQAWDAHYQRHAAALARRVQALLAMLDSTRDGVDPAPGTAVGRWLAALAPYRSRGARLVADRRITLDPSLPAETAALYPDLRVSPFHRRLLAAPDWERLRDSDGFVLFRLMLNYTYLHLTRSGVAPEERFLLCHLAANAAEDHYGVSAEDIVDQRTRTLPSMPVEAAG